jgi:hypothetical protein
VFPVMANADRVAADFIYWRPLTGHDGIWYARNEVVKPRYRLEVLKT